MARLRDRLVAGRTGAARPAVVGRAVSALCLGLALGAAAGAPAEAAFPGRPGPIAYSLWTFEQGETGGGLLTHPPRRAAAPRPLSEGSRDANPSYSADGRLIVFEGNREAVERPVGEHIYVMSSDGGAARQLTSGDFDDSNPAFSPDGRRVVFDRRDLSGREKQIFSVAIDGTDPRRLTGLSYRAWDPEFTPDGRHVVFVGDRRPAGPRDRSNLFIMRADGAQVRLLIGGPREERDPDVSPDGRRVAFAGNRGRGPGTDVFVARLDGTHVRRITRARRKCGGTSCLSRSSFGCEHPSFAPDGRHLAYLRYDLYGTAIMVARTDGRGRPKAFDTAATPYEGEGTALAGPAWGARPTPTAAPTSQAGPGPGAPS